MNSRKNWDFKRKMRAHSQIDLFQFVILKATSASNGKKTKDEKTNFVLKLYLDNGN